MGASYAIHKILEQYPGISSFCTATDGNHGRAVQLDQYLLYFSKKSVSVSIGDSKNIYNVRSKKAEKRIKQDV